MLLLQMLEHSQNKIYYKGNPTTNQSYLPNSALKNRTKPTYLVQFPQGQHYFNGSRKKQYTLLHHQSQIKKIGLFQEDQSTYNHGTYQVSDIQGAKPNTLVSQAVKNRAKGHSRQYGRNFRSPKTPYGVDSLQMNNVKLDGQQSEYQLQKKLLQNRTQIKNYHTIQNHRVQTQPTNMSSPQQRFINQQVSYRYSPQLLKQSTQVQKAKIKDLEQLLFNKEENRLKKGVNDSPQLESKIKISSRKLDQQPETTYRVRRSQKQIELPRHGENHKLTLIPRNQIRKFNPTYLSSQNFLDTQQKYRQFLPQIN